MHRDDFLQPIQVHGAVWLCGVHSRLLRFLCGLHQAVYSPGMLSLAVCFLMHICVILLVVV